MSPRPCEQFEHGASCPYSDIQNTYPTAIFRTPTLQRFSEHPAQVRPFVFFRYFLLRYNPYLQAKGRIDQLKSLGHSTDKVEYIIMGGTFMSLPDDYRDWFIRSLHDTLSGHTSNSVDEAVRDVFPRLSFCNILHRYAIANKAGRSASASLLKLGPTTATSRT